MAAQHDHDHGHGNGSALGGHGHGHTHALPVAFGTAFAVGAALNLGFVAAQVAYGILAHSMALLADAVHNLGDVLGLLLAWGAAWLARRRPSARWTYGLGRGSILAALLNAAVLLISIGAIAVEAIRRFGNPAPVAENIVMIVAGIGVLVNGVTAWLFRHGHHDLNIRATFVHMAADAGISLGVVVAALAISLTGWQWIDPAASLAIVVIILVSTWGLLRDSLALAMDGVPSGIAEAQVAASLGALPGVVEVHDLHIWGLSTTETALTAHLVREQGVEDAALIQSACRMLNVQFRIGHATLQLESPAHAMDCQLRPADVV
jgi:cobalt-zinc-cadmium efflux system protein